MADDADSANLEFWDAYAFAEQSEEEREAYRRQDSIAKANPRPETDERQVNLGIFNIGPVGVNINPAIDRTSITGWMFGAELEFLWDRFALSGLGKFGERSTKAGTVAFSVGIIDEGRTRLTANASIFSDMPTIQEPRALFGRIGFLNLANIAYAYNHDYYRRDGFDVNLTFRTRDVDAYLTFREARHYNQSIIDAPSRVVVRADEGNYRTLTARVELFKPSFFREMFGGGDPVHGSITATVGEETISGRQFAKAEGMIHADIPTFQPGYNPMQLNVDLNGGWL